jgi:hypothetical protein
MKHGRGLIWRNLAALGSVGATFAVACAGSDIPEVTNETRDELVAAYTSRGRGGSGGAGGQSNGGSSGSAGGAAGDGGASPGGAAGTGGGGAVCNGFAVLEANCSTSNCHGAGSNLGNFAESEEAALSYVGEEGAICGGQGALLDPESPEDSVIVLKLADDAPCGQPMPLNADPLEQSDIDCLVEWIGSL